MGNEALGLLIQLLIVGAFGTVTALIAHSRGRSAIGWFFVGVFAGCIGLILVLVLPDLKAEQEKQRRLIAENRRLRERVKKDRLIADQRHSETQDRLGVHDVALGVDTTAHSTPAVAGRSSTGNPSIDGPPRRTTRRSDHASRQWFWGEGEDTHGPIAFSELERLWATGTVTAQTEVWFDGMGDWAPISAVRGLREELDV